MDPNLLNAQTATTQITKPASIPHRYTNRLCIKVFFLLLGQRTVQEERLLALHPSALRKGDMEIQGKIPRVLRFGLAVHSSIL